jgi:hypothetical protein
VLFLIAAGKKACFPCFTGFIHGALMKTSAFFSTPQHMHAKGGVSIAEKMGR